MKRINIICILLLSSFACIGQTRIETTPKTINEIKAYVERIENDSSLWELSEESKLIDGSITADYEEIYLFDSTSSKLYRLTQKTTLNDTLDQYSFFYDKLNVIYITKEKICMTEGNKKVISKTEYFYSNSEIISRPTKGAVRLLYIGLNGLREFKEKGFSKK